MLGSIAVLDANTLIPAALRDTLLRAASHQLFRPVWSSNILDEVERALSIMLQSQNGHAEADRRARRVITAISGTFGEASVDVPEALRRAMQNEPKDRHVLAAAVVSRAEVIVTNNLKDFPEHALSPYDVVAVSPDAFLCSIMEVRLKTMITIVERQAADLHHPPMTVERVLESIAAGGASDFAERVRRELPFFDHSRDNKSAFVIQPSKRQPGSK